MAKRTSKTAQTAKRAGKEILPPVQGMIRNPEYERYSTKGGHTNEWVFPEPQDWWKPEPGVQNWTRGVQTRTGPSKIKPGPKPR